jgi:hypothetical protein
MKVRHFEGHIIVIPGATNERQVSEGAVAGATGGPRQMIAALPYMW